jgi:hypothetical protein
MSRTYLIRYDLLKYRTRYIEWVIVCVIEDKSFGLGPHKLYSMLLLSICLYCTNSSTFLDFTSHRTTIFFCPVSFRGHCPLFSSTTVLLRLMPAANYTYRLMTYGVYRLGLVWWTWNRGDPSDGSPPFTYPPN